MTPDAAKDILKRVGLKYSKQRAAILELLAATQQPLNAAEITQKLNEKARQKGEETPVYWPSTVYRTLEFLLQAKLVAKLDMPGSELGAFIYQGESGDQHVAVCLSCQKVIPLADCPLHNSARSLAEIGFEVTGHRVEIYGHCAECRQNGISKTCPCCQSTSNC